MLRVDMMSPEYSKNSVSADWSITGASELLRLADHYGAFLLRNALAIAVVLGKQDGSLGF